jgi:hypothetical protein
VAVSVHRLVHVLREFMSAIAGLGHQLVSALFQFRHGVHVHHLALDRFADHSAHAELARLYQPAHSGSAHQRAERNRKDLHPRADHQLQVVQDICKIVNSEESPNDQHAVRNIAPIGLPSRPLA